MPRVGRRGRFFRAPVSAVLVAASALGVITGCGGAKTPEVEEVLADAYARLAELELKQNHLEPAGKAIEAGLTHTSEPTYFKGHLVEVQGLVEEARSAELADAGKTQEAARSREKAIQLLEEVVRIQDQVIQKSLSSRDAEAPK